MSKRYFVYYLNLTNTKSDFMKQTVIKKTTVKKAVSKNTPVITSKPVNHIISKTDGAAMVARFEDNSARLDNIIFCKGREFDKSLFEQLLKLKGCSKIRVYNAVNDEGEHTFVITAVAVTAATKTKPATSKDIYFKMKAAVKTKAGSKGAGLKSAAMQNTDGVGNQGQQCPAYDENNTAL